MLYRKPSIYLRPRSYLSPRSGERRYCRASEAPAEPMPSSAPNPATISRLASHAVAERVGSHCIRNGNGTVGHGEAASMSTVLVFGLELRD